MNLSKIYIRLECLQFLARQRALIQGALHYTEFDFQKWFQ